MPLKFSQNRCKLQGPVSDRVAMPSFCAQNVACILPAVSKRHWVVVRRARFGIWYESDVASQISAHAQEWINIVTYMHCLWKT